MILERVVVLQLYNSAPLQGTDGDTFGSVPGFRCSSGSDMPNSEIHERAGSELSPEDQQRVVTQPGVAKAEVGVEQA